MRRGTSSTDEGLLFEPALPEGLHYREDFVDAAEAAALAGVVERIEFSNFELRGVIARRRVALYGASYDGRMPSGALPATLLPLRAKVAAWAGVAPDAFAMALINEYTPGAPIGWHRDAPQHGLVAGVSLLSPCRLRFRPYLSPSTRGPRDRRLATHELRLAPRSAYLMTGESRDAFEHSIPPVTALRYSITFRTLRA